MGPAYTRAEVIFLLSLTENEARERDEAIPSCAAGWGDAALSVSAGEETIPTILRWLDVQGAKAAALAAIADEHADVVTTLRVNGHTEASIARVVGTSDSTVRRRFGSALDAIMLALGGELIDTAAARRVALCLVCGKHPRARAVTYGAKRKGQPRPRYERQMAICRECATAAAERTGNEPPMFTTLIERTAA